MKVAVIGGGGYIAGYLKTFLEERAPDIEILSFGLRGMGEAYLDLRHAERFDYGRLDAVDFVIFTAAVSSPDRCASDYAAAYRVNVTGTSHFIEQAILRGCKVIFLSSDAVYGFTREIVDESTETVCATVYGKMKKEIEDGFRASSFFKSLRLSYVFSATDKFSQYLKECVRNRQTAEVFHPFCRCCVTISEVADVVFYLLNEWERFPCRFLNVCGPELVSRVQIAQGWNRFYEGKLAFRIVPPPNDFLKNRPSVLEMRSRCLDKILKERFTPFSEKMDKEIREFREVRK